MTYALLRDSSANFTMVSSASVAASQSFWRAMPRTTRSLDLASLAVPIVHLLQDDFDGGAHHGGLFVAEFNMRHDSTPLTNKREHGRVSLSPAPLGSNLGSHRRWGRAYDLMTICRVKVLSLLPMSKETVAAKREAYSVMTSNDCGRLAQVPFFPRVKDASGTREPPLNEQINDQPSGGLCSSLTPAVVV
jgi:hypothetical protein